MSYFPHHCWQCDYADCPTVVTVCARISRTAAQATAERQGWSFEDDRTLCPPHALGREPGDLLEKIYADGSAVRAVLRNYCPPYEADATGCWLLIVQSGELQGHTPLGEIAGTLWTIAPDDFLQWRKIGHLAVVPRYKGEQDDR